MRKLTAVIEAIDAANAQDPRAHTGEPEALLYGQRMTQEALRLFPDASQELQIAARGQHIERWVLKRADYPQGRAGYLKWRRDLGVHHATRVAEIMRNNGYDAATANTVGGMLRKEGIKRNVEVQMLEDVICVVFLKWYFTPFASQHEPAKVTSIVQKTARKMSAAARARVLDEFDLPNPLAEAFRD